MINRLMPFAADLWQHRALLGQFILRNVELRHKGSHLGLIWSFLSPVLMLGLYVLVFGYIFQGSFGVLPGETRVDYALGIFLGLTIFHFVSEVMGVAPGIIVSNPNFVKKVVFPLEILPAATVGGAAFHMLISFALALLGIVISAPAFGPGIFWIPVIFLPLGLFALGLGWLLSAIGVFFRDINQLIQFLSMALMWASGIFYTAAKYPLAWPYLRFNPLLLAVELTRDAVLWHRPINLTHLGYLYAFSVVLCYLGYATFRKLKPAFADVL